MRMLTLLLTAIPLSAGAVDWEYKDIAAYEYEMYSWFDFLGADFDNEGGAHIVWFDNAGYFQGPNWVKYTYKPRPDAPSETETVATLIDPDGYSLFTPVDIAVNKNVTPNVPVIVYADQSNPCNLISASKINGVWETEIIKTFPPLDENPDEPGDLQGLRVDKVSLVIDNEERIHVAYDILKNIWEEGGGEHSGMTHEVGYAVKNPTGWEYTDWLGVHENPNLPRWYQDQGSDLAVEEDGTPLVSFCEFDYWSDELSSIYVARRLPSGEWIYDIADTLDIRDNGKHDISLQTSIIINRIIRIAYVSFYTGTTPPQDLFPRVYYLFNPYGNWNRELVYTPPYTSTPPNIEILQGDYGVGVMTPEIAESTHKASAALFARDTLGNWVNIMPLSFPEESGMLNAGFVNPWGLTALFYDYGFIHWGQNGGENVILKGSYEIPDGRFAPSDLIRPRDAATTPQIKEATVAPNPVREAIKLNFDLTAPAPIKITVFDLVGRRVYAETYNGQIGNNTVSVYVRDWPRGLYIYDINSGGSHKAGKIVLVN